MSEITKEDIAEIFERKSEKLIEVVRELVTSTMTAGFQKVELMIMQLEKGISEKINKTERELDNTKMELKQALSRTDKLFTLSDSFRDVYIPKIAQLEKKNDLCQRHEDLLEQIIKKSDKRFLAIERKIWALHGAGVLIGIIAGAYKLLS